MDIEELKKKCELTEGEIGGIEWNESPSAPGNYMADFSFIDDYLQEVKRILEIQLEKAIPIIREAVLDVDEEGLLTDEAIKELWLSVPEGKAKLEPFYTQKLIAKAQLAADKHREQEAVREERRRIQKLYEDMGLVPEEDSPYYDFWASLSDKE